MQAGVENVQIQLFQLYWALSTMSPAGLLSSNGTARDQVASLFTHEKQKRLTRDLLDTFATYADFIHAVTDTACWAQTCSTDSRVFEIFRHRFTANS